ncbi:MAG TPA: hypothetical protein VN285_10685, partial [Candidatus Deferrimicrobium sp.]|nr:hypothetical protein [Candidatus Deferrimicrobium sp.]
MATYYTPGVYIEEIPTFPPSVAAVKTAIPAFIGFTEKAVDEYGHPLPNMKVAVDPNLFVFEPKRITSLLEFQQYFGRAEIQDFRINVRQKMTETGVIRDTKLTFHGKPSVPNHFLYYS